MTEQTDWQSSIDGTWHGVPGVYSPDGDLNGHLRATRSVLRGPDGATVMRVRNSVWFNGELAQRFGYPDIELTVSGTEDLRTYQGRDIFGAARPLGSVLFGHDFIRPWRVDTQVCVQLLGDGTQFYSCLCFDGPRMVAAIAGRYMHVDGDSDSDSAELNRFIDTEKETAREQFGMGMLNPVSWAGEVDFRAADGTVVGVCPTSISWRPAGPLSGVHTLRCTGAVELGWTATRTRMGCATVVEGEQVMGNGTNYGRAFFATQHVNAGARCVRSREVLLDGGQKLAVAFDVSKGGTRVLAGGGVLSRED